MLRDPAGPGMRVAVVAETFRPAVNGVVNSVLRVVDHLAVRGHDPVVIAPSGASYESRCGAWVEVVTVPAMRLPRYRQLALARPAGDLTPLLRRLAPDAVHLASPAVLGLAAGRAARALGVPSVAVFQTDLAAFAQRYRLPGGPAAAWHHLRTVHGTADLTLAPSSATAAMLARQGIGPVALWPRGVDLEQFAPAHRSPALRAELAPRGELLVGVVARLAVEKRLDLLAAVAGLPGVQLVVVGDGPQRRQLGRALPGARFLGQLGGAELGTVVASLEPVRAPGGGRDVLPGGAGGARGRGAGGRRGVRRAAGPGPAPGERLAVGRRRPAGAGRDGGRPAGRPGRAGRRRRTGPRVGRGPDLGSRRGRPDRPPAAAAEPGTGLSQAWSSGQASCGDCGRNRSGAGQWPIARAASSGPVRRPVVVHRVQHAGVGRVAGRHHGGDGAPAGEPWLESGRGADVGTGGRRRDHARRVPRGTTGRAEFIEGSPARGDAAGRDWAERLPWTSSCSP